MSGDWTVEFIFGYSINYLIETDNLKLKTTKTSIKKYNEDTGEPYYKTLETSTVYLGSTDLEVKSFDDLDKSPILANKKLEIYYHDYIDLKVLGISLGRTKWDNYVAPLDIDFESNLYFLKVKFEKLGINTAVCQPQFILINKVSY